MDRLIIKDVSILTMNSEKKIFENGVVVIKGDAIEAVGDKGLHEKYKADRVIDGNNGILIPGMVNTHTHAAMVVFRSLGDDFADRLKKYIFPLEKKLVDKNLVSLGSKYGIAEMLLSGVTTFADMYYFEDEVAKAAKEMGIRAVLGETVVNFPSPDSKVPYGGLDVGEQFIEKWLGDDLITPAIAPHATYTNDSIHIQKASALAEKFNVPMMMHVAEMEDEIKKYRNEYNMTPVQYLESLSALNERFIAAHLIHVSMDDMDILDKRNIGIAHNIGANAKAGKGVPPLKEMVNRKMRVGLGSDGPMSGNTLDIINQMSLVAKIHKLFNHDRTLFPARDIVEMATLGGARALKLDNLIGSIEPGKKADLVILETDSVNMQPIYDYYSTLVYAANAGNVDTVIVNGKVLVRNKCFIEYEIEKIQQELKALNLKIKMECIYSGMN
ncbi:amidohydrolase [Desulfosporosinus sp. FKB]|uniref:amidohydrolase n=1 Tax=Desulfosporosinus sp. FKB TaxID=1969835 RepID=UPI000B49E0C7|nr:amidohydrolase [Desulfosporosinus sp. FKB]